MNLKYNTIQGQTESGIEYFAFCIIVGLWDTNAKIDT